MRRWAAFAIGAAPFLLPAAGVLAQEPPEVRIQDHPLALGPGRAITLAAIPGGGLLAAWQGTGGRQGQGTITVCRFGLNGVAIGCEEIVPDAGRSASRPVVAAAGRHNLVAGWKEEGQIKVRKLDGPSSPLIVTSCCAGGFDLAATPDGFVAVWEAIAGLPSGTRGLAPVAELKGQRFTWGEPDAPEEARTLASGLNGERLGDPDPPRARLVDGRTLLVAWGRGGVKGDVFLGAFDAAKLAGLPPGALSPGAVNLFHAGLQRRPALAAQSLEDLRAVWESGPPAVKIDLALCLDGQESARTAPEEGGLDRFSLGLAGASAALADPLVVPADGSLRLGVLQFGGASVRSLLGGTRLELRSIGGRWEADEVADRLSDLAQDPPEANGEGATAARCLCTATALLSGGPNACPRSDEDLCRGPIPDLPSVEGPARRVVLLFTGSLSCLAPPVSPSLCHPTAAEESCLLQGAARLARQRGVTAVNVVRGPDSGLELARLATLGHPLDDEPRIDLSQVAFSADPRDEGGFVGEAADAAGLVQALGRALAAEEGAEGGIFARFRTRAGGWSPEIQVNSSTAGGQSAPDVALDPQGTTLFVWEDRPDGRIAAQFFDPQGRRRGTEIEVSARSVEARRPRAVALGLGRFAVLWEQEADGAQSSSVWGRLLAPPARGSATPR